MEGDEMNRQIAETMRATRQKRMAKRASEGTCHGRRLLDEGKSREEREWAIAFAVEDINEQQAAVYMGHARAAAGLSQDPSEAWAQCDGGDPDGSLADSDRSDVWNNYDGSN